MELKPVTPTAKGPASTFTGDVYVNPIYRGDQPSRMIVSLVRFTPGARTNWHSHAVGQTLYVAEGLGRVQSRGSAIVEIRPGDVIHTPAGEWHWHGAAPDHFMTHIAMWEAPAQGPESEWGELVTDAEYGGH